MPFPSFFLPHAKVCRASCISLGKALQNYFHDVKINFHDVKIDFQTLKIDFHDVKIVLSHVLLGFQGCLS